MTTMKVSDFVTAVDEAEFAGVTPKNVRTAVRRILRDIEPDQNFQFDARGVQILFDMFRDSETKSTQPLTPRVIMNYENLFLHAAHQIAATPVNKRIKVQMTLAL